MYNKLMYIIIARTQTHIRIRSRQYRKEILWVEISKGVSKGVVSMI